MSPFEFVTVLISIILGLGITQIMSGVADLIHQWKSVRLYWPHLLWVALVFVLHVQEWWLIYQLKTVTTWRLPMFLFQVLYPICLFILARILFPMTTDEHATDMKGFYLANYRKLFMMVMILTFLSAVDNLFIHMLGLDGWIVQAVLFAVLGFLAARSVLSERLHQALAVVLLVVMISGIILNLNEWSITD